MPELEPSYLADIFTALADTVAAEPAARCDVEAAFAAATTEVDDFMRVTAPPRGLTPATTAAAPHHPRRSQVGQHRRLTP